MSLNRCTHVSACVQPCGFAKSFDGLSDRTNALTIPSRNLFCQPRIFQMQILGEFNLVIDGQNLLLLLESIFHSTANRDE